ncbi:MAG: DUF4430 domain-containing protein [Actinobacteria bacterium]|nr:DUF4430 domain-containing protein [Actinomycetota bacterium]
MIRPLLGALLLAGCGAGGEEGTASLWITRDRGARVLFQGEVPAGVTVMQALRREAEVETGFGGRFVEAIDGLEGSQERDWFYFVNGVEADRGATDYRLRDGEIAWWDYRRWTGEPEIGVVVGAFPEPFLHGYDGERRPAHVRFEQPSQAGAARTLGKLIGAATVEPSQEPVPQGGNALLLVGGGKDFRARLASPRGPYTFVLAGDPARLARDPTLARFRFTGLP